MSKYTLSDRELELLQTWLDQSNTLPDLLSNMSEDLQKRNKIVPQIAKEKAEKIVIKALKEFMV